MLLGQHYFFFTFHFKLIERIEESRKKRQEVLTAHLTTIFPEVWSTLSLSLVHCIILFGYPAEKLVNIGKQAKCMLFCINIKCSCYLEKTATPSLL